MPNLFPCRQAASCARQEPMRRRRSREAAAIEIAFQREDDALYVGVVSKGRDQAGLTQSRQGVAQLRQPTSQATTGCITDPHVLDQLRRAESALQQVGNRPGVTM